MAETLVSTEIIEDFGAAFSKLYTLLMEATLPLGMSMGQVRTLAALQDSGPQRVTGLAELLRVTQPTTSNVVKRMEGRGWVVRVVDSEDHRAVEVCLTKTGKDALDAFIENRSQLLRAFFSRLPDGDRYAVIAAIPALHKLIKLAQGDSQQH